MHLPGWLTTVLGTVGRIILLLVVVALGVLFDARLIRDKAVLTTLALRMMLGLALGFACVWLFDLQGLTRSVVLLGSAAPIGFSAVVIASRESLDRELAASAASISVLLALALCAAGAVAAAALAGATSGLPWERSAPARAREPEVAPHRCRTAADFGRQLAGA